MKKPKGIDAKVLFIVDEDGDGVERMDTWEEAVERVIQRTLETETAHYIVAAVAVSVYTEPQADIHCVG